MGGICLGKSKGVHERQVSNLSTNVFAEASPDRKGKVVPEPEENRTELQQQEAHEDVSDEKVDPEPEPEQVKEEKVEPEPGQVGQLDDTSADLAEEAPQEEPKRIEADPALHEADRADPGAKSEDIFQPKAEPETQNAQDFIGKHLDGRSHDHPVNASNFSSGIWQWIDPSPMSLSNDPKLSSEEHDELDALLEELQSGICADSHSLQIQFSVAN